jgi:PAS domain-containing protein
LTQIRQGSRVQRGRNLRPQVFTGTYLNISRLLRLFGKAKNDTGPLLKQRRGNLIVDAENKTIFVNDQLADMFAYAVDEMMGRPISNSWTRSQLLARHIPPPQGIKEQYDFKYRSKDGNDFGQLSRRLSPLTTRGIIVAP